jgi:serine/threonine-protein kinase
VLTLGSVLADRYQILEEIGHGGMGRVYRATDNMLGDDVALKTLLAPQEGSQDEARLLREVQICRKITHPNVVRVHDVGRYAGGLFVTMELLAGKSLHAVLHRQGRLNLKQAKTVLSQVAQGLSEAHELGVVHRDLKPGNVFVTDRHVKVLDFGIARMDSQETRLTRTGSAVGSPHYMSPEQLRGLAVDGRSDLYALGVMAFTLIAGHEPFQGDTIAAVAVAHLQQPPPDLRSVVAGIPAARANLVARLLAKSADGRPGSAADVVEELSRLATEPVASTSLPTRAAGPG